MTHREAMGAAPVGDSDDSPKRVAVSQGAKKEKDAGGGGKEAAGGAPLNKDKNVVPVNIYKGKIPPLLSSECQCM
jgi:hypothetical protein